MEEHGGPVRLSQDRHSTISPARKGSSPARHLPTCGLLQKQQTPVRGRDTQDRRVAGPNGEDGVAERLMRDVPALATGDGMTKHGSALDERYHRCAACLCRSS